MTLGTLADKLLLGQKFLEEIEVLLREKRQVIFQGPPGTGKTYVAQALANCLAGGTQQSGYGSAVPPFLCLRGFRAGLSSHD